jgi:hypothetical protein
LPKPSFLHQFLIPAELLRYPFAINNTTIKTLNIAPSAWVNVADVIQLTINAYDKPSDKINIQEAQKALS